MDLSSILDDIKSAVGLAKTAMELGMDAAPYIATAYAIGFQGKKLTPEERQAMTDQEAAFRAQIDAVIAVDDAATD